MNKWVRGILISVVAGLFVWFLTRSPHSPLVGPQVALADVSMPDPILAGEEFGVSFRATNQNDKAQPGCQGFVEITPAQENNTGNSNSDNNSNNSAENNRSSSDDADPTLVINDGIATRNIDLSLARDKLLSSRLEKKPVIPEAITVPIKPKLFARRDEACQIINSEFTLKGVSGSAVQVMADCVVQKPGLHQMTYGIYCAKDEDSRWRLDHQGYIRVEKP